VIRELAMKEELRNPNGKRLVEHHSVGSSYENQS